MFGEAPRRMLDAISYPKGRTSLMALRIGSRRVRAALLAGAVLGSTLLGGVAQAEGIMRTPGADGIIHACYADVGGLRVIDPLGHTCKREETALQWNQTGPQGPAGQPGPAGLTGYQQVTGSINNLNLAGSTESVHVLSCPAGKKVFGGGFILFNPAGFLSNNTNGPVNDAQWAVSVYNPGSSSVQIGDVTF
jgi:hypothetical protein